MAINKNHEFEDIAGIKCAVVERNASQERIDFLKHLLESNQYAVMITATAAPKASTALTENNVAPALPSTFTIGVTDVMFNATNAVFGRLLRTPEGQVVTLAYWQQKNAVAHSDRPYFDEPPVE